MEGDYVYRPLANAENIRALTLQPAKRLKDPLICSLEEVSPEHTSYTALSYSWAMEDDNLIEDQNGRDLTHEDYDVTHGPGDSSPIKPLVLEGAHVLVGQNLRDALRRLRPNSGKPARLWVDALCINQRDDLEKSSQVSMMASIYHNANLVVAWLGEGEEEVNAAAEIPFRCLLADSAEDPTEYTEHGGLHLRHGWKWDPDPLGERQICDVCRGMGVTHADFPQNAPFQAFQTAEMGVTDATLSQNASFQAVQRAYYRWKKSPESRCGKPLWTSLQRTWQGCPNPGTGLRSIFLHVAVLILSRRRYFTRLWIIQEVAKRPADRVAFQWGAFRLAGNLLRLMHEIPTHRSIIIESCKKDFDPLELSGWVEYSSTKQCFDPRDRVYGLFGCTSVPSGIRPDYDKDLITVYADFARYLLAEGRFETVLFHSCGGKLGSQDGMPTWMPDLRQGYNDIGSDGGWVSFSASPSISADSRVLHCSLAYKGTIVSMHTAPTAPRGECNVVWRCQDPRTHVPEGFDMDNPTDRPVIALLQEKSASHRQAIGYQTGDILCTVFYDIYASFGRGSPLARVILRSTQMGQWRIIGSWTWQDLRYTISHRPEQLREYWIV